MDILQIAAYVLIMLGTGFCVIAVVGMLRFPDVYCRYHAGTKGSTAGNLLILAGVALLEWSLLISLKLLLIAIFFLMTNPVGTHAIARAAYRSRSAIPCLFIDCYREFVQQRAQESVREEDEAAATEDVSS